MSLTVGTDGGNNIFCYLPNLCAIVGFQLNVRVFAGFLLTFMAALRTFSTFLCCLSVTVGTALTGMLHELTTRAAV